MTIATVTVLLLLGTDLTAAFAAPSATQHQVAQLAARLQAAQQQSEVLGQRYDQAMSDVEAAQASATRHQAEETRLRAQITVTSRALRSAAVRSYMLGSAENGSLDVFLTPLGENDTHHLYLRQVQHRLHRAEVALKAERAAAASAASQAATAEQQASQNAASASALLAENTRLEQGVQAQLTSAKADLARQAQAALAAKEAAAQQAAQQAAQSSGANGPVKGSPTPSRSGAAALQAALSQSGVPYVWGGETAGKGFDCSGLTQWAWAQAGVSIPRTAAAQWAGVAHVSLGSLQPGDLLFYYNLDGDHTVDHVVMYAGSGPYGTNPLISAPHTGATVGYGWLFTSGLVGAARP